jgi:DNA-binding transcriptional ArsR family regulator
MIQPQLLPKVVQRLRALADESRIRILLRLKQGECNVSTLVEAVGVGQASVSKHLAVLKQVGLVDVRRSGNQMIYKVCDESVFDMCSLICDGVVRHLREEQALLNTSGNGGQRRARKGA